MDAWSPQRYIPIPDMLPDDNELKRPEAACRCHSKDYAFRVNLFTRRSEDFGAVDGYFLNDDTRADGLLGGGAPESKLVSQNDGKPLNGIILALF
jgi:hypothetical protein